MRRRRIGRQRLGGCHRFLDDGIGVRRVQAGTHRRAVDVTHQLGQLVAPIVGVVLDRQDDTGLFGHGSQAPERRRQLLHLHG